MNIVFLHLSDIHIRNEADISDLHLRKIVDSLKSYKFFITNIVLVLSGDLTFSGDKSQFDNVRKTVGTLLRYFKSAFRGCYVCVLPVPGNHDVMHDCNPLEVSSLKNGQYSSIETGEFAKLTHFYNFAKQNRCFEDDSIYYCRKMIDVKGFRIQANLVNNAIYSSMDEYKGLLYMPRDRIDELNSSAANFTITIMHHSPDFYRDEIKSLLEEKVIGNSAILFYGHEHNNVYRRISYDGSNMVVIQSGGCLCNKGDWSSSSYRVGVLDTGSMQYSYQKFLWNPESRQYEHDAMSTDSLALDPKGLPLQKDFSDLLYDDNYKKDYYVFPTVILLSQEPDETKQFKEFDEFLTELLKHQTAIITGTSNIGKSMLLRKLFDRLWADYIVLFCSPDILLQKSNKKRRDIDMLLKDLFKDMYGDNDSLWQSFEQCDKSRCIFIFDDFDQTEGIDRNVFLKSLSARFGKIILSSSQTIDFSLTSSIVIDGDNVVKFKINPPFSSKRKQLIENVARKRAIDKSDESIAAIVNQINQFVKSLIKIIPPEPYFIVQIVENYFNNVGEAVNSGTGVFSKIFEANITSRIDFAIKKLDYNVTVELLYVLFGKIGYYIHFNKAYPVSRRAIDEIIQGYNEEYGRNLVTEDIISIAKTSKVLIASRENSESFRFCDKSLLAYFVAKEIISKYRETKDPRDVWDIINKCCLNICTDILLFIIFQTDDISILKNILSFVQQTVSSEEWTELVIPNNTPNFLLNVFDDDRKAINVAKEKESLARAEEKAEIAIANEFQIKDIYDWDDNDIEEFNNRLIRMASLLHIISKALPCFEHKLKKDEKQQLIECLYRLPNRIFLFWAKHVDGIFSEIINELKLLPYVNADKTPKLLTPKQEKELEARARGYYSRHAIGLLLNLYYIPVLNAAAKNTFDYLTNKDFFDFSQTPTHILEHLMMLEQNASSDEFVKSAMRLSGEFKDNMSILMLRWIVRHGIITRSDKRTDIDKLQQKFFQPSEKTSLLIERTKRRPLNE